MSDLFNNPRFHEDVSFHRHTQRSVSWLELFYDLVYVATLIQIGNFLSNHLTLEGFGQTLVMLFVAWWAWAGATFYQNRFVADDIVHRLLLFSQIFAIAGLGLSVSKAFDDLYVQFTLFYVAARAVLVVMYIRNYFVHPPSRGLSHVYGVGFSVGILLWLASLLLPAEYHWVGWLVAIAVELAVPLVPVAMREQLKWHIDTHHLSERFGIFTIIVLGESFVKVLDDAQGFEFGFDQFLFSLGGFAVLFSLWWLYFSDAGDKEFDSSSPFKTVIYIYGHLPLAVSLVAFGVAAKKLYSSTLTYADKAVNEEYRLLYTVSIVIYLVALAFIDYGINDEETPQSQQREAIVHLVSAVMVAIIGLTFTGATPFQFVGVLAVIMVVQVIFSVYQEQKFATETSGEH